MDELKVLVTIDAATSIDLSSFRLSLSFHLWHSCLGHVSPSHLRFLTSTEALEKLQSCDISNCNGCKLTKIFALPFNLRVYVYASPFDLIHSNV